MSTFQNILSRTGLSHVLAAAALAAAPAAQADIIASWTFQNGGVGKTSSIAAESTGAGVSNAFFSTGNTGIENWGGANGKLLVTRYFDSLNTTPSLMFTLGETYEHLTLDFTHFHNHNPGFPTAPKYNFAVQLNSGNGWQTVMADLIASAATNGQSLSLNVADILAPGSYAMRWIGYGYSRGSHSGTEYFALDNVTLSGVRAANTVPEPASLALVALALTGVAAARRKRA